jgi:23S rRNA (adenine2503-C2)-methyltransferase
MTTENPSTIGASRGTRTLPPVARLPEEWADVLEQERPFRAQQVFRWIHQHGEFSPSKMTNLSRSVRDRLEQLGLAAPARVERLSRSADGTRKLLLELRDGALVECVLIPMTKDLDDADVAAAADDEEPTGESPVENDSARGSIAPDVPAQRVTLCISTQVGCAMGCVFCASGKVGLSRGLDAAEIVSQVLIARRYLDEGETLRNLVFMGMGEPLHHYEQTRRAITLITHAEGLNMSPRRITVSTVGLVPGIKKLGEDFGGKLGLAVSLHAPDDGVRDQIMPVNRRFNLATLVAALKRYPLPRRRRITIEYTLILDVNDSEQHAEKLARTLRELRVKVNLIPMNPIEASSLKTSTPERVRRFHQTLLRRGVSCSVRKRRGDDVDAACGQLALKAQGLISAEALRRPSAALAKPSRRSDGGLEAE